MPADRLPAVERLIQLDASRWSVVAVCRDCPGWRTVATTRAEARAAGDAHRRSCHPVQATYMASKRKLRA